MKTRMALLSSALVLAGIAASEAQTPNPPPTPQPPATTTRTEVTTTQPAARRAKQVLGSKMMLQGNVSVGTVDDIVFNDEGWIEYLVVLNDGKLVAVPWQAAKFNFEQRQVVVNIPETRYREIPTFTTTTYPNFYEPAYRTRIYTYYNIQPQDRRGILGRDRDRDGKRP